MFCNRMLLRLEAVEEPPSLTAEENQKPGARHFDSSGRVYGLCPVAELVGSLSES